MRRFKISTVILLSLLVASAGVFPTLASAEETETITIISQFDEEKGLVSNSIFGLKAEAPGKGWGVFIASVGGLHVYVDDVFLSIFQGREAAILKAEYITTEEGNPTETLWAYATGEGKDDLLYRVSSESGLWTAERLKTPEGSVTALSVKHRTLYVGTGGSLFYIEESELKGDLDVEYREILTDVSISAVASMGDGTLALGMKEGRSGALGLKIIGGEISGVTGWVEGLSGADVTALLTTEDGLLIGTDSSGIYLLGEGGEVRKITSTVSTGRINDILLEDGRLYAAADGGLFVGYLTTLTRCKLSGYDGSVTALAPGPGSLFWVGTKSGGLYLVEYRGAKE